MCTEIIDSPVFGSVGQVSKPLPMFCVSVKPWRHSDVTIWATFSWNLSVIEV